MVRRKNSFWENVSNFFAIAFVLSLLLFVFIGPLLWAIHSLKKDTNPLHKYGSLISGIALLFLGAYVVDHGQQKLVAAFVYGLNALAVLIASYSLWKT
jgi:hypothetical protein